MQQTEHREADCLLPFQMSAQLFHPAVDTQGWYCFTIWWGPTTFETLRFLLIRTVSWAIIFIPSPLSIYSNRVTQLCCTLFLAVLNCWSEGLDNLKWTFGSTDTPCTQLGVIIHRSACCYFNSVLCHSSESESLYFSVFQSNPLPPHTLTLPPSIYSLLNLILIDRAWYLWWVSGQWGVWKWNRDVQAWGLQESNIVLYLHQFVMNDSFSFRRYECV